MSIRLVVPVLPALLLCGLLAGPASAQVLELERGYPLEVEDAYPIGYLGREIRTTTRYQRGDDGSDEVRLTPEIEIGFPRNAEITVSQPFIFGNAEPDGVGNTALEFLYNLNQETLTLPAFSAAAFAELPTNDDAHGVDPGFELLATKTLPGTWHNHRVHGNFLYQANDDVQAGERGGRYKTVLGYSTVLTNEMLLVADLVREETMEEDEEHNLGELGLRYQLTPAPSSPAAWASGSATSRRTCARPSACSSRSESSGGIGRSAGGLRLA